MDNGEKNLKKALKKRALGYDSTEVTEEYQDDGEGGVKLVKRKVVKKNVPPDVSAAKLLIELNGETSDIEKLSDEELEKEKQRLLSLYIKENYDNQKK
ncbi:MAG: hypothetical protein IJA97_01385 [Clostridia bacterium]|nr:hypothetical protein [Clostridia bacterium]